MHVPIFDAFQARMAKWGRDAGINRNLFGSENGTLRIRRDALAIGVVVGPFGHRLPPFAFSLARPAGRWDGRAMHSLRILEQLRPTRNFLGRRRLGRWRRTCACSEILGWLVNYRFAHSVKLSSSRTWPARS